MHESMFSGVIWHFEWKVFSHRVRLRELWTMLWRAQNLCVEEHFE